MSSEIFVHKTDYNSVNSLLNALVGLGLLAGGTGMTMRGIKALRNRVTELPIATTKKPSRFVQRQDKLKKILLNPEYTAPVVEEPVDDVYKTASAAVKQYQQVLEKDANWFGDLVYYLNPGNWSKELDKRTKQLAQEALKDTWASMSGSRDYNVDSLRRSANYITIKPDAPFMERLKGNLATRPGFRSLWFLPGATAALGLGYIGGDRLMDNLDTMLGTAKMRSVYKDKAEKIYQQSVKYLQDVAHGKVKTKKDESETVKESSFQKKAYVTGQGDTNFIWNPNILLALVLAGLTAKQIKGGIRGFDAAKRELADRTHLQRAFQAARKEREGDYNGLHLEMDPEPVLTPMDKSLSRKTNKLVSDTEKGIDPMLRYENYQMERIRGKQDSIW